MRTLIARLAPLALILFAAQSQALWGLGKPKDKVVTKPVAAEVRPAEERATVEPKALEALQSRPAAAEVPAPSSHPLQGRRDKVENYKHAVANYERDLGQAERQLEAIKNSPESPYKQASGALEGQIAALETPIAALKAQLRLPSKLAAEKRAEQKALKAQGREAYNREVFQPQIDAVHANIAGIRRDVELWSEQLKSGGANPNTRYVEATVRGLEQTMHVQEATLAGLLASAADPLRQVRPHLAQLEGRLAQLEAAQSGQSDPATVAYEKALADVNQKIAAYPNIYANYGSGMMQSLQAERARLLNSRPMASKEGLRSQIAALKRQYDPFETALARFDAPIQAAKQAKAANRASLAQLEPRLKALKAQQSALFEQGEGAYVAAHHPLSARIGQLKAELGHLREALAQSNKDLDSASTKYSAALRASAQ